MAIGVKVMRRPVSQTSYVRATLQGMVSLTFQHLFRPTVTMQYPEEKSSPDWTISGRWRGTHRMLTDEQGPRKMCGLRALPPRSVLRTASNLVPGEDEQGNRYPLIYEIDEFPVRVLRLLPGSVSGGSDPRGCRLRELRILTRPLRLRPGAAVRPDAPGLDPLGSGRSQRGIADALAGGPVLAVWGRGDSECAPVCHPTKPSGERAVARGDALPDRGLVCPAGCGIHRRAPGAHNVLFPGRSWWCFYS